MSNQINPLDIEELAAEICGFSMDQDYGISELDEKLSELFNIEYEQFEAIVKALDPLLNMGVSPLTDETFIGFGTKEMWIAKKNFPGFVNQVIAWMGASDLKQSEQKEFKGYQRIISKNGEVEFELFLLNPGHVVLNRNTHEMRKSIWDHLKEHLTEGREVCITPDSVLGQIITGKAEKKEEEDV